MSAGCHDGAGGDVDDVDARRVTFDGTQVALTGVDEASAPVPPGPVMTA